MSDNISYTPEEVAQILKISRFTVYELIKRGKLTAYRIGRKMRIEASDLDLYKKQAKGLTQQVHTITNIFSASAPAADNELVICGQDALLDVLTRHLEKQLPNFRFLRNYAGSMNALLAMYHGIAHVATTHLWDGDTGEYNIPYVRHLLPGRRVIIVNLVYRYEGFFVAAENPKQISTWSDLTRQDIRLVNREKGSGARVLLDEQFRLLNIDHNLIHGYAHEETSHFAVASCIARQSADVGIGIEKVALQVPNITFIPLQKERYDLVIFKEDLDKPQFKIILPVLRSPAFRNEIKGMGNYDISRMGDIIAEF